MLVEMLSFNNLKARAKDIRQSTRDKVIRLIRRGKRAWKEASGYGKRWLVESFFLYSSDGLGNM